MRPTLTLTFENAADPAALDWHGAIPASGVYELWPPGLYEKLMDALATLTPSSLADDPEAVERAARALLAQKRGRPSRWSDLTMHSRGRYLVLAKRVLRTAENGGEK